MALEMGNGNEKLFIVPEEDFLEEPQSAAKKQSRVNS